MILAQEALKILHEGNHRFVSGVSCLSTLTNQARRRELAVVQEPFAIILGCSDSRVPAEIIFDQGLGDLFVSVLPKTLLPHHKSAASSLPRSSSVHDLS